MPVFRTIKNQQEPDLQAPANRYFGMVWWSKCVVWSFVKYERTIAIINAKKVNKKRVSLILNA